MAQPFSVTILNLFSFKTVMSNRKSPATIIGRVEIENCREMHVIKVCSRQILSHSERKFMPFSPEGNIAGDFEIAQKLG